MSDTCTGDFWTWNGTVATSENEAADACDGTKACRPDGPPVDCVGAAAQECGRRCSQCLAPDATTDANGTSCESGPCNACRVFRSCATGGAGAEGDCSCYEQAGAYYVGGPFCYDPAGCWESSPVGFPTLLADREPITSAADADCSSFSPSAEGTNVFFHPRYCYTSPGCYAAPTGDITLLGPPCAAPPPCYAADGWSTNFDWCNFSGPVPMLETTFFDGSDNCSTTGERYSMVANGTCVNHGDGSSGIYYCVMPDDPLGASRVHCRPGASPRGPRRVTTLRRRRVRAALSAAVAANAALFAAAALYMTIGRRSRRVVG